MSYEERRFAELKQLALRGFVTFSDRERVRLVERMPRRLREAFLEQMFPPISKFPELSIAHVDQWSMMARWSNVVRLPSALG